MSKPLFACVTCGEDFTRRTSAERHNRNVHNGYCLIVRYVEYLAGLASRLYPPPITPPRLSRRNKLIGFSIDRNKIQGNFVPNNSIWRGNALDNRKYEVEKSDPLTQFLNRLYKQSEYMDLLQELSGKQQTVVNDSTSYKGNNLSTTKDSSSLFVPDLGYETNQANNSINNNQSYYSYLKANDERKIQDPIDKAIDEGLAFGRKLLEYNKLISKFARPVNPLLNYNGLFTSYFNNFQNNHSLGQQEGSDGLSGIDPRRLFGYKMFACSKCHTVTIIPILYSKEKEEKNELTRLYCDPSNLLTSSISDHNLVNHEKHQVDFNNHNSEPLIQFLDKYSFVRFDRMISIPLSNIAEREQIVLPNPVNQNIPLTFSYSKERHIELDLDNILVQRQINPDIYDPTFHDYNYIVIAVDKGHINLNYNEVIDFIKLIGDSTFAFFKIKRNGLYTNYCIALTHNINSEDSSVADTNDPNIRSKIFYEHTTSGSNMTALTSLPSFVKAYM